MYVDLVLLFMIYAFSVIALATSVYALWTLKEVEAYYKEHQKRKTKSAWDHYHSTAVQQAKTKKSHWG